MIQATEEVTVLEDSRGCILVINFLSPDKPNEGLAFRCCPDGKQDHNFEFIKA